MNKEEAIIGSKLLSEFEGWKYEDAGEGCVNFFKDGERRFVEKSGYLEQHHLRALGYFSDWNSLMRVKKKLNEVLNGATLPDIYFMYFIHLEQQNVDIEACFSEVVKAVKWCNDNKEKYKLKF